jgi:hypothetical protein
LNISSISDISAKNPGPIGTPPASVALVIPRIPPPPRYTSETSPVLEGEEKGTEPEFNTEMLEMSEMCVAET